MGGACWAAWMPSPCFGISATIGFDSEIPTLADMIFDNYYYDDDDYYRMRLAVKPSLLLRTPSLLGIKSQGMDLRLFAQPGATLSPQLSDTDGSGWIYWRFQGGITATFSDSPATVSLSYGYSSYNLYDGLRYSDGNSQSGTHSVTLILGYKF